MMGGREGEIYFLEALAVYRKINLEVDSKSVQFFAIAFTNFLHSFIKRHQFLRKMAFF